MKVILASGSKQRKEIFDRLGIKYEVVTSLVEEQSNQTDPKEYVKELSRNKAYSVKEQLNEKAIIIASDAVICFENKIYEKPKTKEEAFNNMKEMSGKTTQAVTGITILDMYQDKEISMADIADVKFFKIDDEDIRWYVENEKNVLNCCGYTVLGKASIFLEKVDGDYNTLIGISPSRVYNMLKELGYKISDFEMKE